MENSLECHHTIQIVGPSWEMEQLQEVMPDDFKDYSSLSCVSRRESQTHGANIDEKVNIVQCKIQERDMLEEENGIC